MEALSPWKGMGLFGLGVINGGVEHFLEGQSHVYFSRIITNKLIAPPLPPAAPSLILLRRL